MPRTLRSILLVLRDGEGTPGLIAALRERDLEVIVARDGEGATNVLDERAVDAVVAELEAGRIDGLALLERARERRPDAAVVLVADAGRTEAGVEAMRRGAHSVQVRPVPAEMLVAVLERAFAQRALATQLAETEGRLDERLALEGLTGRSRAIRRVIDQVRAIAAPRATVLIEGEPGTGKHLVAHSIHRNSPRRGAAFAWLSCGALPPEVIEGELFGNASVPGRLELADHGTLLLEDIADAPASLQFKLLRVVQDRTFERVGEGATRRVDVRILASTDRDLGAEVAAGRFRDDLYQRLSVVRLSIPPLRERPEDIAPLVETLVREIARARGRRITGATRGVLDRLVRHPWPGNVRELRDLIDSMVQSSEGRRVLDLADLPAALREPDGAPCEIAVGMTMEEAERILLVVTLSHTGNDKPRAAAMLGIGLRTLYRKIKQYGLR